MRLALACLAAIALHAGSCTVGDTHMGTQYNGLSANISVPSSKAIASSTNANPIVVTTSSPHGMTSGDQVDIYNHQVNTNANGQNVVTVLSANTFSIPVAGNGVGGATGTAAPLTFGSTFQIPSDGDLVSAANNNIAPEALGDRTVYNLLAIGDYKMTQQGQDFQNDATLTSAWCTISSAVTAWTAAVSGSHIPLVTIDALHALDWVEFEISFIDVNSSSSGSSVISFGYSEITPGVAAPAFQKVQGSGIAYCTNAVAFAPYTLIGRHQMGINGSLRLTLGQTISTATSHINTLQGDFFFRWRVWRPVSVNQ